MTELLAPNGKPSNLTPKQYELVRTSAFKEWFGDWENLALTKLNDSGIDEVSLKRLENGVSKVVDENGEPLVLFHGSISSHTIFEIPNKSGAMGRGIYLTTDIKMASFFGEKLYQLFANIKNPKYVNTRNEDTQMLGGSMIYLRKKGKGFYDGACNENVIWLAIEPNQIKLADGTNTKFDGNNPDIRFDEGGLVAPNGKNSNLTPEQYKLVRTSEFKDWFGDWENSPENSSKIVDENGEPLVLYHGTRNRFSVFDINKSGESNTVAKIGFWFTPIKSFAHDFSHNSWYGKDEVIIYPVFLSIKEPKVFKSEEARYGDSYQKLRTDIYKIAGQSEGDANVGGLGMSLNNPKQTIEKYRSLLNENGFDGVVVENTRFDIKEAGGLNDQYVALYPNQIKLANGTNTTFDENNPDIRYAGGGNVPKTDRNGDYIGDGSFHAQYNVYEFDEYPQISSEVSKSESTESVYVTYFNSKNGEKITCRFSHHENNAVKFGYQLNGYSSRKEEILYMLGLPYERKWISLKEKYILGNYISMKKPNEYEKTNIDFYEIYKLPIGTDISNYTNKIVKKDGRDFLIKGDEIIEKQDPIRGYYEYIPTFDKLKKGGITIAQTPASKKDQIKGSDKNKEGSSKDLKSAKKIELSDKTIEAIKNKVDKHNEKHPNKKITIDSAKAVVRRGMGAYSSSHRPTIKGGNPNSRVAWGLARLNAFLYKIVKVKSKSGKYSQDNDLIEELGYEFEKYADGGEIKGAMKNEINNDMTNSNPKDTITMDVPLLIRFAELMREDIKSDVELHQVIENLIEIKDKGVLTMGDYESIVGNVVGAEEPKTEEPKTQEPKMEEPKMEEGGKVQSIHSQKGDIKISLDENWYSDDTDVELVPVSELIKFREFDRKVSPKYNKENSVDNINHLKFMFQKEGVKSPIIIEYSSEDNSVLIIEGNHRLNSAIDLGMEYLPARVVLRKYGKYSPAKIKNAMKVNGVQADSSNYIPSNLKPSQVGIAGAKPIVYAEGGIIEGRLHSECGEDGCGRKFQVGENGHIIEAERDEAVIVADAFESDEEITIEGTPSEIASALNVIGGGKNFDKGAKIIEDGEQKELPQMKQEATDTDVDDVIDSGSVIINRRSMADEKEYKVTGSPKQIASAINSIDGNGVVIEEGAEIE